MHVRIYACMRKEIKIQTSPHHQTPSGDRGPSRCSTSSKRSSHLHIANDTQDSRVFYPIENMGRNNNTNLWTQSVNEIFPYILLKLTNLAVLSLCFVS